MGLESFIDDVEDFPTPGVVFKDITPLLADPHAFASAVDEMARPFVGSAVSLVAGIEARGFLFGPPIAQRLGVGFVPLRKPGKLPSDVIGVDYDLEYGSDRLEMHRETIDATERVLIVDDVLATGGTLQAAISLIETAGASVEGISVLINLGLVGGAAKTETTVLHSVLELG